MPQTTRELPQSFNAELPVSFDFGAAAGAGDINAALAAEGAKLPTFQMDAYTGGELKLGWGIPVFVDIAGVEITAKSRPILRDHDAGLVLGHSTDVSKPSNKTLVVAGVISGSGPHVDEVLASGKNGFPWQASVGLSISSWEDLEEGSAVVNGQTVQAPAIIARKSKLNEVSIVALGADDNTQTSIAAKLAASPKPQAQEAPMTPEEIAAKAAAELAAKAEADKKAIEAKKVADEAAIEAAKAAALSAAERVELEALRAGRPQTAPAIHTSAGGFSASVAEAALCVQAGLGLAFVAEQYGKEVADKVTASKFRGYGIGRLMGDIAAANGVALPAGRLNNEGIRAAFRAGNIAASSGAGFASVNLPGILGNVANKSMTAGYKSVNDPWPQFVKSGSVSDFKTHTRYSMTAEGEFADVTKGGEISALKGFNEQAFTIKAKTEGATVALTREDIINDDLGALTGMAFTLGRKGSISKAKQIYAALLNGASGTFFTSGHGNLQTGGASALGVDSLTKAIEDFLLQTDANGDPIMVSPSFLVVPPALQVLARQLFKDTEIAIAPASAKTPKSNPHAGLYTPLTSPYLQVGAKGETGSATAWYLFANPNDLTAIEIGYLNGVENPIIEQGEMNFDILGIQWRAYQDFGIALQDYRGAHKSAGV